MAADERDQEREALLTLLMTPGLGPTRVNRCLEALGSAQQVLEAPAATLAQVQGISPRQAAAIHDAIRDLIQRGEAQRELERIHQAGATLISLDDPDYPQLLRLIPDPPPMLWVRGQLQQTDGLALGIVGARRCSHYGREQAQRFAYQCAQAGLCIVSGGAYGIDAAAHRGAIQARGRTIAVLGSGLGKPYPSEHAALFDQIAREAGAVVSEFSMLTPPLAQQFPRRNRIISGLSLGVLVVEAAARSGALITARLCVEEHGREAMALPGRVDWPTSEGCHRMIREGWATLVTNAPDVLDALGETGQLLKAQLTTEHSPRQDAPPPSLLELNLTDSQQRIVEALSEPRTLDQLTRATDLPVQQLQADLTLLEIRGAVRRQGGQFTRRTAGSGR